MPLPTDPLLSQQWHLGNASGFDLNVRAVWNPTTGLAYTGAGIRVVVVDDGFDYTHPDLAPNWDLNLDFDWDANNNGDNGSNDFDPFGQPGSDWHGTAVAGIIGADNNGTGAVGVAFDVSLVGYRTHGFINDGWLQDIRDSIHHGAVTTLGDVINISQGIANDENSEFAFGYNRLRFQEIETAIGDAVNDGRGGLGTTIVKAAGNSRTDNYDVNADDWTNDTRQVVVAAVDQDGFVSSYSSYGSAILVSGFGSPGQVVTTDRVGGDGYSLDDFTNSFNGTSAATPMVAGVVALMYDANAGLGWRDIQNILANTARHVGSDVGGGTTGSERYNWEFNAASTWNGGGLHFSNDYGFGLVDALAAVRLAETWFVGYGYGAQYSDNEFTTITDMLNTTVVIPDGDPNGTVFSGDVTFDDTVERVTVTVTFSTTFVGDVLIYIISPDGTESQVLSSAGGSADFNGTWTFESQAFRGERAAGTWSVRIVDANSLDALSVSDVVVTTYGSANFSDRYIFTNEFSDYAGQSGHAVNIVDTNGGSDVVNASPVSSASTIRLDGAVSTIDGVSVTFANIENAVGGDGSDRIVGNNLVNALYGGRGNDTLIGGGAGDLLIGGVGNDTYYVDSSDDIREFSGQSTGDRARASISYVLQNGDDVEFLETTDVTLTTAINLTGNSIANTVTGNAGINVLKGLGGHDTLRGFGGNDTLEGGVGSDTLIGGLGNDIYIVDAGDTIVEGVGEGTADRVRASATFTLKADDNIEFLETTDIAATTVLTLTGNDIANTITGNNGTNILKGLGGNDTLNGQGGNDTLAGGLGNDTLNGGTGFDIFLFNTALNSTTNKDIISGYIVAEDTIQLENAIFTQLVGTGTLSANQFFIGTAANDADCRIIYNSATGALVYDSNGSLAGGDSVFAVMGSGRAMTAAEFYIV